MTETITQGATAVGFVYDAFHARVKSCVGASCATSVTHYLNDAGMSEKTVASSVTTWKDYLSADGKMVAMRSCTGAAPCTSGAAFSYFVTDNLGSPITITDASGGVTERLSTDAWGRRRNANGTDNTACNITSASTRGFTGHETIDATCMINMNARIYDPTIARFMSADSIIPDPFDMQAFNRYSYVNNNPLKYIDPTGHQSTDDQDESDICDPDRGRRFNGSTFENCDPQMGSGGSGNENVTVTGTFRCWSWEVMVGDQCVPRNPEQDPSVGNLCLNYGINCPPVSISTDNVIDNSGGSGGAPTATPATPAPTPTPNPLPPVPRKVTSPKAPFACPFPATQAFLRAGGELTTEVGATITAFGLTGQAVSGVALAVGAVTGNVPLALAGAAGLTLSTGIVISGSEISAFGIAEQLVGGAPLPAAFRVFNNVLVNRLPVPPLAKGWIKQGLKKLEEQVPNVALCK